MEEMLATLSDFQLYFQVALIPESGLFYIEKLFTISLSPHFIYPASLLLSLTFSSQVATNLSTGHCDTNKNYRVRL